MYTTFQRTLAMALLSAAFVVTSACGRDDRASTAQKPAGPVSEAGLQAAQLITASDLRAYTAALSADELEGRAPATPGDEKARQYIVEQLQQIGVRAGGPDGGWQQRFEVVGITAKMPQTWSFTRGGKSVAFKWWDDYVAASGVQQESGGIDKAEVVFVGYGIQAPEYGWDDFKGQDLKGKVLLMLNSDPDWDPNLFAGNTRLYYGRWVYKYESAARQGAAGAIIVHTTDSAGYPFQVVQTSWSGEQVELPAKDEPRLQLKGWLSEDASRRLVALAGQDLAKLIEQARSKDFTPVPLGVATSIKFTNTLNRSNTANVYGLLEGSDERLRDEYVIYTAHHDHLGVGEPDAEGDKIYNGALDNASGVAQVLSIAKAFKALEKAPRRSIMFLLVAAEEQGLLGSQYYAQNPTVPAGKIAANINFDAGNKWGRTSDVVYIGKGKSTLDPIVESIAKLQNRTVTADQFPDRGYFYRSDQFNFAKIGVPALYLDTGTQFLNQPAEWGKEQLARYDRENYHQPSDELTDDWNFDGMVEDTQLGFWVGLAVADAPTMPTWVPGDEFEAARKRALQDAQSSPPAQQ